MNHQKQQQAKAYRMRLRVPGAMHGTRPIRPDRDDRKVHRASPVRIPQTRIALFSRRGQHGFQIFLFSAID
jgi:hypothetical protein